MLRLVATPAAQPLLPQILLGVVVGPRAVVAGVEHLLEDAGVVVAHVLVAPPVVAAVAGAQHAVLELIGVRVVVAGAAVEFVVAPLGVILHQHVVLGPAALDAGVEQLVDLLVREAVEVPQRPVLPLTLRLTALGGLGVILLVPRRIHLLGALAVVMILSFVALVAARPLIRALGSQVEAVITRLLGVLLAALAAQFVIDGLQAQF